MPNKRLVCKCCGASEVHLYEVQYGTTAWYQPITADGDGEIINNDDLDGFDKSVDCDLPSQYYCDACGVDDVEVEVVSSGNVDCYVIDDIVWAFDAINTENDGTLPRQLKYYVDSNLNTNETDEALVEYTYELLEKISGGIPAADWTTSAKECVFNLPADCGHTHGECEVMATYPPVTELVEA